MVVERGSNVPENDLPPEIVQDLSKPVNLESFFSDPNEAYRRAIFYHLGTVPYLRYV